VEGDLALRAEAVVADVLEVVVAAAFLGVDGRDVDDVAFLDDVDGLSLTAS